MTELKVEVEPGAVGFDAARLARIESHFARYVDDGRLPGWLILVSRGGKIVYLGSYGYRDLESRAPIEWDTLFRIYSMTKPITAVAAMMLYEEGAFMLNEPVSKWIPEFANPKVVDYRRSHLRGKAPASRRATRASTIRRFPMTTSCAHSRTTRCTRSPAKRGTTAPTSTC